jgi:peptidoglycan/LPS O-acetylase OafA/YrhL
VQAIWEKTSYQSIFMPNHRIVRLEACRGIAALIVLTSHCVEAFAPSITSKFLGTPFYVLINGMGAVVFFFVLSGYVLTIRFFYTHELDLIVSGVFKRLPRLALLATIGTIFSAVLWLTGAYKFETAGAATGSEWLTAWAMGHQLETFHPSLLSAAGQGLWRTFLNGESYFDTSLWTMQFEFVGSLPVLLLAPIIVLVFGQRGTVPLLLIIAVTFRMNAR